MRAEKQKKVITCWRVVMPSAESMQQLAAAMGMNENTVRGYLNVSNNRCAPKAIKTQMTAINVYGGRLVKQDTFEETLIVYDDDETILYELTK